ncbi:hypothetical protein X770_32885 [Mesorhizobium sp. LSJC269B00]|nr:hypothetical protein X770_32885 [Mesorhizobium sp. LSJC269B00]
MPAKLASCRVEWFPGARNASNVIARKQPATFADQRVQIVCVETDCLIPFCREILVLSWTSRQGNWMKAKTLGRLDKQQTITR